MADVAVAVLAGDEVGVLFDSVEGELFGAPADSAHQVVVVAAAVADSVQQFAVLRMLGFHELLVGESMQNAVDAGQPDSDGRGQAEIGVQLLGTAETIASAQCVEHDALPQGHTMAARHCALS